MSKVFVLDTQKQPLEPVHPGRARLLLKEGKAAVYRRFPFTIMLKRAVEEPAPAPLRLKIDPGAKTTGLALVNDASGEIVWAAELFHRGAEIKKALDTRRAVRRGRRSRRTRYRRPRWANRSRKAGWLPPSLFSRVENILTWVQRIRRIAHVTVLSQELVRFDLQKLENSEITGLQYQQGTLFGYEIREYTLEKWNRTCSYCGATGIPLQLEHIQSRARGGSNRISNICLACEPCNLAKGTQDVRDFLKERTQRNLQKTHWCDAACVGASTPEVLQTEQVVPLLIEAFGRGHRRIMLVGEHGFPRGWRKRKKRYFGYQTGDLVRAVVPQGARRGTHVGRVAVKASGYFTIQTKTGKVSDVAHRYCQTLHRTDGYGYHVGARLSPRQPAAIRAPVSSPA